MMSSKKKIGLRVKAVVHDRYRFLVDFRKEGERVRKFFYTRGEAERFVMDLQAEARRMPGDAPIFDQERVAVLEARRLGVDLLVAVREKAERMAVLARSGMVKQVCGDRLAEVLLLGRSKKYVKNLELFLGKVADFFGEKRLAEVSREDCGRFLFSFGWGAVSIRYYAGLLSSLFEFAMGRGLCERNPTKGLALPTGSAEPVAVASVEQARALLEACDAVILPGVLLALFAGLRPESEVQRLDWSEVRRDEGLVHVLAAKSKSAQRRLVTIQPVLRAWLDSVFPDGWPKSGPVWPSEMTGRRRLREAKRACGWVRWPQDLLRHSFASYHLAMFGDAAHTAMELGHEGTKMLFKHYRGVVPKEVAAGFWGMLPEGGGRIGGCCRKVRFTSND